MTLPFALLCVLSTLGGVFTLGPLRMNYKRVALKAEETFLLKLFDIPRLSGITVAVEDPRDSLEMHIASPKDRISALANFGLIEGDNSGWWRDFGRISTLIGWHESIWSAETRRGALTIAHLYHDLDPATTHDRFEHVVLFRAKPLKIDGSTQTRCVNNVVWSGLPGERRERTFSSGFLDCPVFLLSNYPRTTLSNFAFKGNGLVTVTKVAGLGRPLALFSADNSSDALWAPTLVGSHVIGIHLPPKGILNLTVSVTDKTIFRSLVGEGALGTFSSSSYVSRASSEALRRLKLQSEFPSSQNPVERFEIYSPTALRYRLRLVDIAANANFNLSTDYGRIFIEKCAGWSAELVASRIRVDYIAQNDRGFLLQYSVAKSGQKVVVTAVFALFAFVVAF